MMRVAGDRWSWAVWILAIVAAAPVAAAEPGSPTAPSPLTEPSPVLVTPVQGSEALSKERKARMVDAVRRALEDRGYSTEAGNELLGRAVVACQSPECIAQTLDAAGADFALVPAMWLRGDGGHELTLTLVQRLHRSLNANRLDGDELDITARGLVDELLAKRAALLSTPLEAPEPPPSPRHPNAWKAGPIVLIAGGAAAFIAIGVGAGTKSDNEQLNTAAVAAWSAIGAAALAGGVAWWVVGAKRRRQDAAETSGATLALRPAGVDLRLRF